MKICIVCEKQFERAASAKCCSDVCSDINWANKRNEWKLNNKEHVKEYTRAHSNISRYNRRIGRQKLYEFWGRNGRSSWRDAELKAIDILKTEGYDDVMLLAEIYPSSPFDIIGFKDDQGYVFQVTTRTHSNKQIQHIIARYMRFIHKIIYISFKLEKYVIKDFSPGGISELSMREVLEASKFV